MHVTHISKSNKEKKRQMRLHEYIVGPFIRFRVNSKLTWVHSSTPSVVYIYIFFLFFSIYSSFHVCLTASVKHSFSEFLFFCILTYVLCYIMKYSKPGGNRSESPAPWTVCVYRVTFISLLERLNQFYWSFDEFG